MDVRCSLKSIGGGNCGFNKWSRKQETVIIPLLACWKRFDGHSASFGFSGPKNEVDLILSQAAIFSPPVNIYSMTVCPSHRTKLGLGWTRGSSTKCRAPSEMTNHSKSDRTWSKCDKGKGKTWFSNHIKENRSVSSGWLRYLRNISENPKGPVYWRERSSH